MLILESTLVLTKQEFLLTEVMLCRLILLVELVSPRNRRSLRQASQDGYMQIVMAVSGYYHFSTMWYLLNDSNGTNSYIHTFFRKNGSVNTTPSGRIPYNINMHGNSNNYDDGASYSSIQYLNSGQYVSLCIRWHSTNSRHHAGHQIFSGQLIG